MILNIVLASVLVLVVAYFWLDERLYQRDWRAFQKREQEMWTEFAYAMRDVADAGDDLVRKLKQRQKENA